MLSYKNYQSIKDITKDEFAEILSDYLLSESTQRSRYSVEVNYRTTGKEVLDAYAKIVLGFVSASLKGKGFHIKHVFTEKPIRLIVSSRNFDDGEWTGLISWNDKHNCFVVSKGFYNKDRKTISLMHSKKCDGDSAADISKEVHNLMHFLKDKKDNHVEKYKPITHKRGPKS